MMDAPGGHSGGSLDDTSSDGDATDPGPRSVTGQVSVGVEIWIAVPAIRVWKALLEPDDLRHWFCEHAEVDPRPGGRFSFGGRYAYRLGGSESRGQKLVSADVGRGVTYTWDVDEKPTRVRWIVVSERGDCRLRVIQEFLGHPHFDWREQVADHYPWENYLLNLKMYLERGDAGVRVDYDAIPEGRQVISGPFKCAAERVWRVLTDPEECSKRAGRRVTFRPEAGEGWSDLFDAVAVVGARPAERLTHVWEATPGSTVHAEWELRSAGVVTEVVLSTWGEGDAEEWHVGTPALWSHVQWCHLYNSLKYFAETGQPTGLSRLTSVV